MLGTGPVASLGVLDDTARSDHDCDLAYIESGDQHASLCGNTGQSTPVKAFDLSSSRTAASGRKRLLQALLRLDQTVHVRSSLSKLVQITHSYRFSPNRRACRLISSRSICCSRISLSFAFVKGSF